MEEKNSPIKYNGIDFYQTSWNLLGLRFEQNSRLFFQYPLINLKDNASQIWLTWLPNRNNLNDGLTILIDNLQGYCSIYNKTGQFLGNLELNESYFSFSPYTFVDTINSDGLQIKTDPGIPIIYLGFFFLMLNDLYDIFTWTSLRCSSCGCDGKMTAMEKIS